MVTVLLRGVQDIPHPAVKISRSSLVPLKLRRTTRAEQGGHYEKSSTPALVAEAVRGVSLWLQQVQWPRK